LVDPSIDEKIKRLSFEEAMTELERTVKNLEEGNITLDQSLSTFEYGIKLSGYLNKLLAEAELKITQLVNENQELVEKTMKEDLDTLETEEE